MIGGQGDFAEENDQLCCDMGYGMSAEATEAVPPLRSASVAPDAVQAVHLRMGSTLSPRGLLRIGDMRAVGAPGAAVAVSQKDLPCSHVRSPSDTLAM